MNLDDDASLPQYILAIFGLDESWKERARCRGASRRPGRQKIWFLEDGDPGLGVDGAEDLPRRKITGPQLAQMALAECAICPVQWDCVSYAIKGRQEHCVYAVRATDRKFLRKEFPKTWEDEVEQARAEGVSVRILVVRLRARRTKERREARLLVGVG